MRQKPVRAGQRISGNLSASAVTAMGKLVEKDRMSQLDRSGQPMTTTDGAGIFIDAKTTHDIKRGEFHYLNWPVNQPEDVEGWNLQTCQQVAGLAYFPFGSVTAHSPVVAMATESGKANEVVRMQIAGMARTKVRYELPSPLPSCWSAQYRNLCRTGHVPSLWSSGEFNGPIATPNDNGQVEIAWLGKVDGEGLYDAIVTWPARPRAPRIVHATGAWPNKTPALCPVYTYHFAGLPYAGIGGDTTRTRPNFLRDGIYRITASLWMEFGSTLGSNSGEVVVQLSKSGTGWPSSNTRIGGVWHGSYGDGGPGVYASFVSGSVLGSFTNFETLEVELLRCDIESGLPRVTLIIEGPFNNDYPEASTFSP